jgi:hypothetical protein
MTDDELIHLLHASGDRMTRAQADAVIARGAAIVPRLAEIVSDQGAWEAEGEAFWAPSHATFLLGAIGGAEVVDPLLCALRHSSEEDVDWVYDAMPDILGSVGPPALMPLRALARDREAGTHPRLVACEALAEIADRHAGMRGPIAEALRAIAGLETEEDDVRWCAGLQLLAHARPEDRPLLEGLAREQEETGDIEWFGLDAVREAYRKGPDFRPGAGDWMDFYDPDAIAGRQERWAEEAMDGGEGEEDIEDDEWEEDPSLAFRASSHEYEGDDDGPAPRPYVNTDPTPGRNDPCPCGSGNKYKRCCGKGS